MVLKGKIENDHKREGSTIVGLWGLCLFLLKTS